MHFTPKWLPEKSLCTHLDWRWEKSGILVCNMYNGKETVAWDQLTVRAIVFPTNLSLRSCSRLGDYSDPGAVPRGMEAYTKETDLSGARDRLQWMLPCAHWILPLGLKCSLPQLPGVWTASGSQLNLSLEIALSKRELFAQDYPPTLVTPILND